MAETRCCGDGSCRTGQTVCIDCDRVLDSCKDKDCFEDVRVFLTGCGQDLIEKASSIRVKETKVTWTSLNVEPIQFNRGFYQIYIRFFVNLDCEACVGPGKTQGFGGVAVCDKQVILYGSEGNVNIFRSDPYQNSFCALPSGDRCSTNLPVAVCEVTDPICLNTRVVCPEKCCRCCDVGDIPAQVASYAGGDLCDSCDDRRRMVVSLGFFSVIRIVRPGQYLINATEYSVPDKECVSGGDSDPCTLFRQMEFPTNEFYPPSLRQITTDDTGCDRRR